MPTQPAELPLGLKLAYTLFFAVWVPVYWVHHGAVNFLWFCDLANLVVLAGLWTGSRLLLSSQAVGGLLIQLYWNLDFFGRMLTGSHPLGGTEYMFDATQPLWLRSFSLFHVFVPVLVLWTVWCLGYDRRGWKLQSLFAWILLPLSMLPDPELNLNWVWQPFGVPQVWMPPALYLLFCMAAYPLVLFLPAHALILAWMRRAGRPVVGGHE